MAFVHVPWRTLSLGIGLAAALGCQSSGGARGSTLNGTNTGASSWWPPSFVRGRGRVPANPYDYQDRSRDRKDDPFIPASAEIKEKDTRSNGSGSGGSTSYDARPDAGRPGPMNLLSPERDAGPNADLAFGAESAAGLRLVAAKEDGLRGRLARVTLRPDDILNPVAPGGDFRSIIVRETGSEVDSVETLGREHQQRHGVSGCAWHFVVHARASARGEWIGVGPRWVNQQPAARIDSDSAGREEPGSIVIGVAGRFASETPGEGQRDAVRALVSALAARHRIPPHRIMTRSEAVRESAGRGRLEPDPGPLFRLDEVLASG
jgi:hypothetical protein